MEVRILPDLEENIHVAFLRSLLRTYAYLFHGLFSMALLSLAVISFISPGHSFQFYVLPWTGEALAMWLIGLAVVGLLVLALAVKGILRGVYFLWSLVVLALIVRGYFLSTHTFTPGTSQVTTALLVTFGALLAVFGAKTQLREQ